MIVPTQVPGKREGIKADTEAGGHWAIKMKIRFGDNHMLTPEPVNALIDTGATQLFLPPKILGDYTKRAGAELDTNCDGYLLTEAQFQALPSLFFIIEDVQGKTHEFEYINDAQIWPKALSEQENVKADHCILSVAEMGKTEKHIILGEPVGEYCMMAFLFYLTRD